MANSLDLVAHKQMLLKYTEQLSKVLTKFKESELMEMDIISTERLTNPVLLQQTAQRLIDAVSVLHNTKIKLEEVLREYTNKLAEVVDAEYILKEYMDMLEHLQDKVIVALELSSVLQARVDGL